MSKICGYSCKHNKSGVCQTSVCDKQLIMSDKTEVQTFTRYIDTTITELQQENKQLKEIIKANTILVKDEYGDYQECNINPLEMKQKYEKQVDNWNKLKEWVNKHYDYYMNNEDYIGGRLCFTDMKDKMQELEQGSYEED